jgi:hypothetical protein
MAASTTGPVEPEPQLSAAASPAAPMSASPAAPPAPDDSWKLAWANGYLKWPLVTGYVFSRSHGSRLALIRVTPLAAAKIRARNAESIRHLKPEDVKVYPVGAMIAMETWDVAANETRGPAGPIFFMKKEAPGYDSEAGDWRYGMTRADGSLLADGKDGRATECRACHIRMKKLDFVPAKDR